MAADHGQPILKKDWSSQRLYALSMYAIVQEYCVSFILLPCQITVKVVAEHSKDFGGQKFDASLPGLQSSCCQGFLDDLGEHPFPCSFWFLEVAHFPWSPFVFSASNGQLSLTLHHPDNASSASWNFPLFRILVIQHWVHLDNLV